MAVFLTVRLTPKAAHDRIDAAERGAEGWHLKARVRAVPEDGKANAALIRLVAEALGLARSDISLTGGGKSREKRLRIEAEPADLETVLAGLGGAGT
ncbi:DUF167 family protein [Aureimonas frigidaquae]|uniref:DUF167 family protein n=1 Tax=Aureimonas frigidaquae TaxID=424757 RepID=UPI0007824714|nr:DUF167 family protein [Aureimonas frigidaquae]